MIRSPPRRHRHYFCPLKINGTRFLTRFLNLDLNLHKTPLLKNFKPFLHAIMMLKNSVRRMRQILTSSVICWMILSSRIPMLVLLILLIISDPMLLKMLLRSHVKHVTTTRRHRRHLKKHRRHNNEHKKNSPNRKKNLTIRPKKSPIRTPLLRVLRKMDSSKILLNTSAMRLQMVILTHPLLTMPVVRASSTPKNGPN